MAQIISAEDISVLRTSADILEIIGKHITLRTAGVGRYKGLCPFHDEKTPSFTVSPQMGSWHCFGCGAHGDIYAFFMKLEGLSFPEAVQHVASLSGFELHFKKVKGGEDSLPVGGRQRLLDANKAAAYFFREALASPEGKAARDILQSRKFNSEDIKNYSIGFAPKGWNNLTKHLQDKGFTNDEIVNAGLGILSDKGLYDRFRNRIIWPIFDLTGQVIAFGGRIIDEADGKAGAKYLNTNETRIYKKSQILYGLNWAKKAIAKRKQVIIVEGYTDVMAMHIAGFYNTVGTCGTAFQNSHAKLLRRIMGDWGTGIGQNFSGAATGEVIFIFDGDAAGQAAAQKSFKEDQSFASETLVAIVPDNLDPCDLRIKGGDAAISDLVDSAIPLFEYIIKTQIKQVNLERVEGRIQGLRLSAPILASIKDSALKIQYTHLAAGWLRLDYTTVLDAVKEAFKTIQAQKFNGDFENQGIGNLQATKKQKELSMDDAVLSSILQYPKYVPEAYFKKLDSSFFRQPYSKAIYNLILESGGLEKAKEMGSKEFSQLVFQNADDSLKGPISIFINAPLALDSKTRTDLYVQEIFKTLILKKLNFFISEYQKKVKSLGKGEEKEKDDLVKKILRMEKIKSNIKK